MLQHEGAFKARKKTEKLKFPRENTKFCDFYQFPNFQPYNSPSARSTVQFDRRRKSIVMRFASRLKRRLSAWTLKICDLSPLMNCSILTRTYSGGWQTIMHRLLPDHSELVVSASGLMRTVGIHVVLLVFWNVDIENQNWTSIAQHGSPRYN